MGADGAAFVMGQMPSQIDPEMPPPRHQAARDRVRLCRAADAADLEDSPSSDDEDDPLQSRPQGWGLQARNGLNGRFVRFSAPDAAGGAGPPGDPPPDPPGGPPPGGPPKGPGGSRRGPGAA